MSLGNTGAMLTVSGAIAAPPGPGPTDPPTLLTAENYGVPDKARISWTNGDAAAYTKIYQRTSNCGGAESLLTTVNPGIVSFDSLVTVKSGFLASHLRNGQESAKTACFLWDPAEE